MELPDVALVDDQAPPPKEVVELDNTLPVVFEYVGVQYKFFKQLQDVLLPGPLTQQGMDRLCGANKELVIAISVAKDILRKIKDLGYKPTTPVPPALKFFTPPRLHLLH